MSTRFAALVIGLALLPVVVFSQEPAQPTPTPDPTAVTRLLRISHASVDEVAAILEAFPGQVKPNREAGVIAWTGPERLAETVVAAARELDVERPPSPNLQLAVWLVAASRGGELGGGLPDSLAGVERELRQVLGFTSFKLLGTNGLRVRSGSGTSVQGGLVAATEKWDGGRYGLRLRRVGLSGDGSGERVRIDGLDLTLTIMLRQELASGHVTVANESAGMNTDLDVEPEQYAVVGQVTAPGGDESVLLVLKATVER